MLRLGYAGNNTALPTPSRTFRLARYSESLMLEVAEANLRALLSILEWNDAHDVRVFRVTSSLVPFGSHAVNGGTWRKVLAPLFAEVGGFARVRGMRLSMHPGQFTVINSPDAEVVAAARADLAYHADVLDLLGAGRDARIVLHCGGSYGDLPAALGRLEAALRTLPARVRERIALENDERVCSAEIVDVCRRSHVPAVLDIFHHEVLPSMPGVPLRDVVRLFASTWPPGERQKVHYSDQDPAKARGAHAPHVDVERFGRFLEQVAGLDLDVMIEAKDKERSVLAVRERYGL